jgi:hypothetical protein
VLSLASIRRGAADTDGAIEVGEVAALAGSRAAA